MQFTSKYRRLSSAVSLGLIVLIATGCAATPATDNSAATVYVPSVQTVRVAPGLAREIATTGEVQAVKSAVLTSELSANVQKVYVKVGDSVTAGQLLVQLASASVSSSRSTAGAAYVNAQNSLTQTGLSAEQGVAGARVALNTAQISLANTLAQNEAVRQQAEQILNSAKLASGLSVDAAQTALDNVIRSVYPTADSAVAACDGIIGVSQIYKSANDSYEYFLGSLSFASKPAAEASITLALDKLAGTVSDYASASALLAATEDAILKTLDVLNNSTVGTSFTQATLNADIGAINAKLSAVRSTISALDSAQAGLALAQQNSNGTSQTVLSAEANYQTTLTQLAAAEKSARQMVESAKAALESAQRSTELSKTSARASLSSAAGNLSQTEISQDKLAIRAPFSGKITEIGIEQGDQVAPGTKLISVEDSSQLKIVAYLSAEEVRRVKIGDEVKIAKQSSAKIATIAPSAEAFTQKFAVEIFTANPYLKPGEFVQLRFQIGESDATDMRIFLPLTALNILASGNSVWVVQDGKAFKRPVELGALEGEFVEIVSGLKLDEEVIVGGGRVLDESKDGIAITVTK